MVKDIGYFNDLLMAEATRLNVEPPKNGLPDPTKLADQIEGLVNGGITMTEKY